MRIDAEYYEILLKRNEELFEEVHKEVAWDSEYQVQALDNYKEYFLNRLSSEKFTLTGLQAMTTVTSFRITKPSEFLSSNLTKIHQLLEEEIRTGRTSDTDNLMSPGKFSQYTAIGEPTTDNAGPEETKTEFRQTAAAHLGQTNKNPK
jgi:hypothetical protein